MAAFRPKGERNGDGRRALSHKELFGAYQGAPPRRMTMDRVALVACLWFVGWIVAGSEISSLAFGAPLSGVIWGFILALLTVFLWPWVMPRTLEDWMHGSPR
jgi:hypothetical protein